MWNLEAKKELMKKSKRRKNMLDKTTGDYKREQSSLMKDRVGGESFEISKDGRIVPSSSDLKNNMNVRYAFGVASYMSKYDLVDTRNVKNYKNNVKK